MSLNSDTPPKYFDSPKAFRQWLFKNSLKSKGLWLLIYKAGPYQQGLTQSEAMDACYCFGWSFGKIKSIDTQTYKIGFVPRPKNSRWGTAAIKRIKELKSQGLVHPRGWKTFQGRTVHRWEKEEPYLLKEEIAVFKKHPEAWNFFSSQPPGYKKQVLRWIREAKRIETQAQRFHELLEDSQDGTRLRRFLKMEARYAPQFPEGQTPIEMAKNIGTVCGAELRTLGIETVEKLKEKGWEDTFERLCEHYPQRLNMNCLKALIGATEDLSIRALDDEHKVEGKHLIRRLRSQWLL